eukprot:gnl/Chilomastix_caulleri/1767.p1 GENE.gnl/Chilomastix_caulleri/1767~~gnl/Chilomastix_caulleri/1767.p1  ORF type:complete len:159 (+),score=25.57 gnl/Chilomastix_caulleri/1767:281-757(+)
MLSGMDSMAGMSRSNTTYRHQVLFEKSKYYDEVDYKVDCILNNSIRSFVLSQNNYELWVDPDDSYEVKDFKRSFIDPEANYHSRYVSMDMTTAKPERMSMIESARVPSIPTQTIGNSSMVVSHAALTDEEILNTLPTASTTTTATRGTSASLRRDNTM